MPRRVFYVRYTEDMTVLSTGETDLAKATKFALEHLNDHTSEGMKAYNKRDEFHKLLKEYYAENSPHIEYCNMHNRKVTERSRKESESMMIRICGLTPDVHKYKDLTKKRLIKLQEDLLNTEGKYGKLSVKTVKNHFTSLERIYKELLDKDLIEYNPFSNLPSLKREISQAWDMFPISPFKHKLPIIPFDIMENFETDFVYALLGYIPITETTAYAIKVFCTLKEKGLMKYLKDKNYNKSLFPFNTL